MITIRPVNIAEAENVFDLEKMIWPATIQASKDELFRRLRSFPDGVIGAWIDNEPVGYATCQIVDYHPHMHLDQLSKFLPQKYPTTNNHNPSGNCLHFLSFGLLPSYRNRGLWKLMIAYRISLAKILRLKFVLVDSRMPSYATRPTEFAELSPSAYPFALINNKLVDPYLSVFQSFSFVPIGACTSSYEDSESGNYWAFMVREIL